MAPESPNDPVTPTPPESTPTPSTEDQRLAVDALSQGQVVALPSETVYGLAVRADQPEALAKLRALGGSANQRLTWLTTLSQVDLGPSQLPTLAQRLTERYWPGPLTLMLQSSASNGVWEGVEPLADDGWTAIRAPSHSTTEAILAAAPFPIAVMGAQAQGQAPALSAENVREHFSEAQVPHIVDGGPASLGTPSSVLAVGPGRFEVVRPGIVTADELRRTAGLSLLFVCTGNTCRSPMAEGLARAALRRALLKQSGSEASANGPLDETSFGFQVASAGVYAGVGSPPSEHAVTALKDRGLDLSGHGSRPAIDREVAEADRVYCLTRSHQAALLSMLPPSAANAVELLDPEGRDVPDPFGGPLDVYRDTADVLEAFIEARLPSWV